MSVAVLQLTEELWKSIMRRRQLEMVQQDLVQGVRHSLVDIIILIYAQHARRLSMRIQRINYLG
jgi:hypothetical protein